MSKFSTTRFQNAQPIPALTGEVFERTRNGICHQPGSPNRVTTPALSTKWRWATEAWSGWLELNGGVVDPISSISLSMSSDLACRRLPFFPVLSFSIRRFLIALVLAAPDIVSCFFVCIDFFLQHCQETFFSEAKAFHLLRRWNAILGPAPAVVNSI